MVVTRLPTSESGGSSRPNPTLGRDCLPGFGRSGAVPLSAGLFRCRGGSVTSSCRPASRRLIPGAMVKIKLAGLLFYSKDDICTSSSHSVECDCSYLASCRAPSNEGLIGAKSPLKGLRWNIAKELGMRGGGGTQISDVLKKRDDWVFDVFRYFWASGGFSSRRLDPPRNLGRNAPRMGAEVGF